MDKPKIDKRIFGDLYIVFIPEWWCGAKLDTFTVLIDEQVICTIAGDKIEEFYEKLSETINNYRI